MLPVFNGFNGIGVLFYEASGTYSWELITLITRYLIRSLTTLQMPLLYTIFESLSFALFSPFSSSW